MKYMVCLFVFVYTVFSFDQWDLNPFNWESELQLLMLAVVLLNCVCLAFWLMRDKLK